MRVLFVVNYLTLREKSPHAGIFVERQAESLRRLGVQVDMFDIGRDYSPYKLLGKWRELRRTIDRLQPDVVHAQYGTVVAAVAVLTFHPTVVTFSGSDLLPGASISWIRTHLGIAISNAASLFARHLICVSEELRSALWFRKKNASVIPRGVDLEIFTPGSREEARAKLGWEKRGPVALFAGTGDSQNKGLPLARAALDLAVRDLPFLNLHVIEGVLPEEMPVYYRAADVLLFASRQEGSPNAVKEALACNLPVVSVTVGDVGKRLAGVWPSAVVSREPSALAAALIDVIRAGERSNGRTHVTDVSLEAVAERILAVYRSVAGVPAMSRSAKI